jgi:hypothetical protein
MKNITNNFCNCTLNPFSDATRAQGGEERQSSKGIEYTGDVVVTIKL